MFKNNKINEKTTTNQTLTNYSESALAVRGTKNSKLTPPKKKKKNCRGIKKAFPLSAQMIKHFLMLVNAMKI